jgi:hypothetical protein
VNVAVRDPSQRRYRSLTQRHCIEATVFVREPDNEPRDGLTLFFVAPEAEDIYGLRQRFAHCCKGLRRENGCRFYVALNRHRHSLLRSLFDRIVN